MKTAEKKTIEQMNLTERLFHENETKTNYMVCVSLLALSGLIVVCAILGLLNILDMAYHWCCYFIIGCCILIFILCLVVRQIGFEHEKSKGILMSGVIFISGALYFLYPAVTIFIVFGPTMLSIKYYDERFVGKVTAISWAVFMITVILNMMLDQYSLLIWDLHQYAEVMLWDDKRYVIELIMIPKTIMYVLEGIISSRIADAGRKLVLEQADASNKASLMERDLEVASAIQNKALPAKKYVSEDKTIFVNAYQNPAKEVGGDFYDYFMLNEHTMIMLVADVSDKGLPSAMFVIEAQSIIRFALSEALTKNGAGNIEYINLEKAVNAVNRQLVIHNMDGMFVTMWIGCMDIRSGVGKYINAGHNLPYIRREDGSLKRLENDPQVFLGSFKNFSYQSKPFGLYSGDTLVMYTDGVTDARNKDDLTFGTLNLEYAIQGAKAVGDKPKSEWVCNAIEKALNDYIKDEPQYDDITVLTVSFEGKGTEITKDLTLEVGDESTAVVIEETNKLLESVNCPEHERRNIDVVIDEICSNISMYAYEDGKGTLGVSIFVGSNYIAMKFTDSGIPFNPLQEEEPDVDTPQIGGYGIYLVKNLVDLMNYSYDDGKNTLAVYRIWNA